MSIKKNKKFEPGFIQYLKKNVKIFTNIKIMVDKNINQYG